MKILAEAIGGGEICNVRDGQEFGMDLFQGIDSLLQFYIVGWELRLVPVIIT